MIYLEGGPIARERKRERGEYFYWKGEGGIHCKKRVAEWMKRKGGGAANSIKTDSMPLLASYISTI